MGNECTGCSGRRAGVYLCSGVSGNKRTLAILEETGYPLSMDELSVEYIDVYTSAPKLPAKMMSFFRH